MSSRLSVVVVVALALVGCGSVSNNVLDAPAGDDAAVDAPPGTVRLTIVRGGTASGTVVSDPSGVNCGTTCTVNFPIGTLVTLTATPDAGAAFQTWGGACSGTGTQCSLVLNADVAVNAEFVVQRHTVTVTTVGTGRVTSTPAGIDCPGTCSVTVDHGTMITLNQMAQSGSTFLGWSGACMGTGACMLTVNSDLQLSAAFGQSQSLVVTRSGTGTGMVTSAPAGINCGTDCNEIYPPGTMVMLTAAPIGDSQFVGWTGGCSGTATTCMVTINAATTVDARFDLRRYTLNVARGGTGAGNINTATSSSGIACGTDCSETYDSGTTVTLVASPSVDNTFGGWTGDCTNATGPCTVTMNQNRSVTGRFEPSTIVTLTLSVYGAGQVRSTPAPVSGPSICSSTDPNTTLCTLTFTRGTAVSLTPTANAGFMLVSMLGCVQSGGTCNLTMSASTTVQAFFCSVSGACPI